MFASSHAHIHVHAQKLRTRIAELEHASELEKQRSRRIITSQKQKIASLQESVDQRVHDKPNGKYAKAAAAAVAAQGPILPKLVRRCA